MIAPLPNDHPAIVEGRTVYPSRVKDAGPRYPLLKPGRHNGKLGGTVAKGAWRGMPIYSLTLEERATCPTTCELWHACFGNGMPLARRWRHGPDLEKWLASELRELDQRHPAGFVVRLHILGDFYSVEYVMFWALMLKMFRALHVWGYTHCRPSTPIGDAILTLNRYQWPRWAVRYSATAPGHDRTMTVARGAPLPPGAILCPVEAGQTESCAKCGLCWSPNARDKTIVFEMHGRRKRGA